MNSLTRNQLRARIADEEQLLASLREQLKGYDKKWDLPRCQEELNAAGRPLVVIPYFWDGYAAQPIESPMYELGYERRRDLGRLNKPNGRWDRDFYIAHGKSGPVYAVVYVRKDFSISHNALVTLVESAASAYPYAGTGFGAGSALSVETA